MGAAELLQTTIHCDECGHEFPGNVQEWHNKPCPKCGAGVLVTDADIAVWSGLRALVDLSNALFPNATKADTVHVRINTAPLRHMEE